MTWRGVLLDGHNRFEICRRRGLPFTTVEVPNVEDRTSAKMWIVENQFGRRNLTPYLRAELALKLEGLLREQAKGRQRKHGGTAPGKPKAETVVQNSAPAASVDAGKTRTHLAQKAGVSHDTIDKVRVIDKGAPEPVKELLRQGEATINAAFQLTRALDGAPELVRARATEQIAAGKDVARVAKEVAGETKLAAKRELAEQIRRARGGVDGRGLPPGAVAVDELELRPIDFGATIATCPRTSPQALPRAPRRSTPSSRRALVRAKPSLRFERPPCGPGSTSSPTKRFKPK